MFELSITFLHYRRPQDEDCYGSYRAEPIRAHTVVEALKMFSETHYIPVKKIMAAVKAATKEDTGHCVYADQADGSSKQVGFLVRYWEDGYGKDPKVWVEAWVSIYKRTPAWEVVKEVFTTTKLADLEDKQ